MSSSSKQSSFSGGDDRGREDGPSAPGLANTGNRKSSWGSSLKQALGDAAFFAGRVQEVVTRTAASAQEMLTDKELRRMGTSMLMQGAQKGLQEFQKGVLGRLVNRQQIQNLLSRIESQVNEFQRERQLQAHRKQMVTMQIGLYKYESMPKEARSRMWYVMLEKPELADALAPCSEADVGLQPRFQGNQSLVTSPGALEAAVAAGAAADANVSDVLASESLGELNAAGADADANVRDAAASASLGELNAAAGEAAVAIVSDICTSPSESVGEVAVGDAAADANVSDVVDSASWGELNAAGTDAAAACAADVEAADAKAPHGSSSAAAAVDDDAAASAAAADDDDDDDDDDDAAAIAIAAAAACAADVGAADAHAPLGASSAAASATVDDAAAAAAAAPAPATATSAESPGLHGSAHEAERQDAQTSATVKSAPQGKDESGVGRDSKGGAAEFSRPVTGPSEPVSTSESAHPGTGTSTSSDAGTGIGTSTITSNDTGTGTGTSTGNRSGTATGTGTSTGNNTGPSNDSSTGTSTGNRTGTGSRPSNDTDTGNRTGTGSRPSNDTDSGSSTGTGSRPSNDTGNDTGSGTGPGTDTGNSTGTGSRNDTGPGTGTSTSTGTGTGPGNETSTGYRTSTCTSTSTCFGNDTGPGTGTNTSTGSSNCTITSTGTGTGTGTGPMSAVGGSTQQESHSTVESEENSADATYAAAASSSPEADATAATAAAASTSPEADATPTAAAASSSTEAESTAAAAAAAATSTSPEAQSTAATAVIHPPHPSPGSNVSHGEASATEGQTPYEMVGGFVSNLADGLTNIIASVLDEGEVYSDDHHVVGSPPDPCTSPEGEEVCGDAHHGVGTPSKPGSLPGGQLASARPDQARPSQAESSKRSDQANPSHAYSSQLQTFPSAGARNQGDTNSRGRNTIGSLNRGKRAAAAESSLIPIPGSNLSGGWAGISSDLDFVENPSQDAWEMMAMSDGMDGMGDDSFDQPMLMADATTRIRSILRTLGAGNSSVLWGSAHGGTAGGSSIHPAGGSSVHPAGGSYAMPGRTEGGSGARPEGVAVTGKREMEEREVAAQKNLLEAMLFVPWVPGEGIPHGYSPECRFAMLVEMTAGQEEVDDIIMRDVSRTFPGHPFFSSEEGQLSLFRVLKAYSLHDLEVAYCQGMAFLAGVLLMYLPEEVAFRLYCRLMDPDGPNLRRLYLPGLNALKHELGKIDYFITRRLPELHSRLQDYGIPPVLYASQWLMTVYATPFPSAFCARIVDTMLQEGNDRVMLRIAFAMLEEVEPKMLEMYDFELLLTYLKVEPAQWDMTTLDRVMDRALNSEISEAEIAVASKVVSRETARILRENGGEDPYYVGQPIVKSTPPPKPATANEGCPGTTPPETSPFDALVGDGSNLGQAVGAGSGVSSQPAAGPSGAASDPRNSSLGLEAEYMDMLLELDLLDQGGGIRAGSGVLRTDEDVDAIIADVFGPAGARRS